MSGAAKPPVIPEPFAKNANPLYINTIPETTSTPGAASYDLGFPPITMQPVAGGGKPPFGQDVNGILFALSSHDFYVQAGQLFQYDANVSTALGGYAVGTLLGSTDLQTIWFNTVDANTTDPDSGGAAGWVSLFSSGFQPFVGLTGGTLTLTATQAARKIITLSGTLTSNLAVVLPAWTAPAGRWLIINNTTGAFAVTVRTAGGTGVNIPQGGPSNPVEVYGDGTNIYPTVPAAALIAADQNPTPLTLAQRTNAGYLLATYFNGNSGLENPTIGSVIVQNSAADGFFRKISVANFQAQLALSAFGGQVTAGQVPLSAVIQYAANILASAALTGTPTTPTAAAGTSSSQVASTAFVNPASSLASNGYRENPDGSFDQWGSVSKVAGTQGTSVTFPTPFPTACYNIQLTDTGGLTSTSSAWIQRVIPGSVTRFGFQIGSDDFGTGTPNPTLTVYWRAVGK